MFGESGVRDEVVVEEEEGWEEVVWWSWRR
jgi:hypothetical protein